MAENTTRGGGLYFIVGGLVVAVLVIGYFAFGGRLGGGGHSDKASITIEVPKVKN